MWLSLQHAAVIQDCAAVVSHRHPGDAQPIHFSADSLGRTKTGNWFDLRREFHVMPCTAQYCPNQPVRNSFRMASAAGNRDIGNGVIEDTCNTPMKYAAHRASQRGNSCVVGQVYTASCTRLCRRGQHTPWTLVEQPRQALQHNATAVRIALKEVLERSRIRPSCRALRVERAIGLLSRETRCAVKVAVVKWGVYGPRLYKEALKTSFVQYSNVHLSLIHI